MFDTSVIAYSDVQFMHMILLVHDLPQPVIPLEAPNTVLYFAET